MATDDQPEEASAADSLKATLNAASEAPPAKLASEEDFYYEGSYLVFTAAYHRKRGYCCNSNCRHCPYR